MVGDLCILISAFILVVDAILCHAHFWVCFLLAGLRALEFPSLEGIRQPKGMHCLFRTGFVVCMFRGSGVRGGGGGPLGKFSWGCKVFPPGYFEDL